MKVNSLRLVIVMGVSLGLLSPGFLFADTDDDMGLQLVPIATPEAEAEAEGEETADVPAAEPTAEASPLDVEPTAEVEPVEAATAQAPRVERRQSAPPPGTFADYQARMRLTAEPGLLSPSENQSRLGLFGVDLDVRPMDDWWHVGAGGFGAATGSLGGFFGGGLQGGVRIGLMHRVAFEAGAMIGAGGGSGAPTGSGFFLRPRAGLHLDLKGWAGYLEGASLNVSQLYFPTGDFMSTHLSLSFELAAPTPLSQGLGSGSLAAFSEGGYGVSPRTFRFTSHGYFLLSERSLTPAGESLSSPRMMIGLEYREFFTRNVFGLVEPRALAAGGSAGFAELTVGAGFSMPVDRDEWVSFFGSAGIGGAGGGGVMTGGGIYLRGALGVDVNLPGPFHIGFDVGIQDAPGSGNFTAISTGLRLGITNDVVRPRAYAVRALSEGDEITQAGWRLRPSHSTFFGVPEGGENRTAQLGGLKVDHMFGEYAFVTLQGASSYMGMNRAALSMGTVGIGGRSPEWNRVRLTGEARMGAMGGGGVGAGSGFVVQPMAGVHVTITEALGLELLGGATAAPTGELLSPSMEVGLTYAFSTALLRRN